MIDQSPDTLEEPAPPVLDRKRALGAFDWGALAGIAVALVHGAFWGAAVLYFGLVALAVAGGWLIGAGVRHGAWRAAWRSPRHVPSRRLKAFASAVAVVTWFGAAFVAYVVSRALLPESDLTLAERLAELSFSEYMALEYDAGGLIHATSLAAMVIIGWRTAR
jgi:hypothetical protein